MMLYKLFFMIFLFSHFVILHTYTNLITKIWVFFTINWCWAWQNSKILYWKSRTSSFFLIFLICMDTRVSYCRLSQVNPIEIVYNIFMWKYLMLLLCLLKSFILSFFLNFINNFFKLCFTNLIWFRWMKTWFYFYVCLVYHW